MGAIDTVIGETTKWVLKKIDKFFTKKEPTYNDKASMLFESLSIIDDGFTSLKKTLIPTLNNYSHENPYAESQKIMSNLRYNIKYIKNGYNEIKYDIELHSNKEKSFWDMLTNLLDNIDDHLVQLGNQYDNSWDVAWICGDSEARFHGFIRTHPDLMDEEMQKSAKQLEEQYESSKKKLNKKIKGFDWELQSKLRDYIEALKHDISNAPKDENA